MQAVLWAILGIGIASVILSITLLVLSQTQKEDSRALDERVTEEVVGMTKDRDESGNSLQVDDYDNMSEIAKRVNDRAGARGLTEYFYPTHMRPFRHRHVKLLQFGLEDLNSPGLWDQYFSSTNIYVIDSEAKRINDSKSKYPNTTYIHTRVSNTSRMDRFVSHHDRHKFDIIVDKGLITPGDQIEALFIGLRIIKSGGMYIMEVAHPETVDEIHRKLYGSASERDPDLAIAITSEETYTRGNNTTIIMYIV